MTLVRGKVLHQRKKPFVHGLKYTNYMWLVDLDEHQNRRQDVLKLLYGDKVDAGEF